MYPTVSSDKTTFEDFYINVNKNFVIMNYENSEKSIEFFSKIKDSCYYLTYRLYFTAYIYGFYSSEEIIMDLHSPSYAYMKCTIPASPIVTKFETIECILDTEKFPILTNMGIILPYDFPDISARISGWSNVEKKLDIPSCYPNVKEMHYEDIKKPECVLNDYSTFLTFVSINFEPIESNYTFNLSVSFNYSKNKEIPCEFYHKKLSNNYYYPLYCYSKSPGIIRIFPTIIKLTNNQKILLYFQNDKYISLDKCLFTKKTIYFNNGLQKCSKNYPNKMDFNIILYAKMSNFSSDYSFKINLVNSKYEYLDCLIPVSSGFQALSYIECILDRIKFPLLDKDIITLPTQLSLQDINILNWNNIDKKYNMSSCIPEYSLIFSPEKYIDSYCYKAYNSLISTIGQISPGNINNTKNASDYYNFNIR